MPSVIQPTMPATNNSLSKRRRFQPPITNFFSASEPDNLEPHVSHCHYTAVTSSATPVVPAKVQASLLSVGMRVRKSVAEGYKTNLVKEDEKPSLPLTATETPSLRDNGCHTELAPFSGVPRLSQGHLPSLPPTSVTTTNDLINDEGDAFSLPASSQESTSSVPVGLRNGQKRPLDSEDNLSEDDTSTHPWDDNDNPGQAILQNVSVGRTIISPNLIQQRRHMLAMQQNSKQPGMILDDFEEASFLRRREEVDGDNEEMDCA